MGDKLLAVNLESRDFRKFNNETKTLIIAIAKDKRVHEPNRDVPSIIHLAQNLRRSPSIIGATQALIINAPLVGTSQDWLDIMLEDCLRPFHLESYLHSKRVRFILDEIKKVLEKHSLQSIPDYGIVEFQQVQENFILDAADWEALEWAAHYYDLCKMAYVRDFWDTPGRFSKKQRKALEAHSQLFFYLAEMFNVNDRVTALAVLHHYLNLKYPVNGVV